MIIGLKKWDDYDTYYTQNNNVVEQALKKDGIRDSKYLKKVLKEEGLDENIINKITRKVSSYLETCGPTAATMIIHAAGYNVSFYGPGKHKPVADNVLSNYFNTPSVYDAIQEQRKSIDPSSRFGNEIPQFYPVAIKNVFNVNSIFAYGKDVELFTKYLKDNAGIMLHLIKPGHYVSLVAYDTDTKEFIFNDPWPQNKWPPEYKGKSGFNRRMTLSQFKENVQPFYVVIGV